MSDEQPKDATPAAAETKTKEEKPKRGRPPTTNEKALAAERRRSAYVINVINATIEAERANGRVDYRQCAIDAGYSENSAKQMSYYLRKQPDVQEQIRQRLAASGISDAEIIGFPASVIRFSLADCSDFFPDGTYRFNPHKAVATGAISVIKKISRDARGGDSIELYDKMRAVDLLASIRGLKRADVKPNDYDLRRMVLEDNIRRYREKRLIESDGDTAYAETATAKYREILARMPENRPFMDLPTDDRTEPTDPTS